MVVGFQKLKTTQEKAAGVLLVLAHVFSVFEGPNVQAWNVVHLLILGLVFLLGFSRWTLHILALFTLIYAFFYFSWLPGTFFLLLVATVVLATDLRERFILRWGLFLAYFLPFFHKLNWDFLNPEVSCAQEILTLAPGLLSLKEQMQGVLPYFALMTEGMMSLGLLVSSTVPLALAVALTLHLVMVLAQIYTLPQIMLVMVTGFFDFDRVDAKTMDRFLWRHVALCSPFILRKLDTSMGLGIISLISAWISIYSLLDLFFCAILIHFAFFIFRHRLYRSPALSIQGWTQKILRPWVLAVLIIWGLSAYLGLSTSLSMSMHSNLRTEKDPNHILLGRLPQLFSYQKDVVSWEEYLEMTKVCPPHLVHGRKDLTPLAQWGRVPFGEFDWIPRHEVEKSIAICRGDSILTKGLLVFRPFDAPRANRCRK
ncbi:MAG: hypothetical protein K2Q26_06260 [Bdellovibrionales bacterium]|nr:hypothetical protein [Bdellovibrionales bacterium]